MKEIWTNIRKQFERKLDQNWTKQKKAGKWTNENFEQKNLRKI